MVRRETHQKDAIRQALVDAGRPLSVNELLESAKGEAAGLGIATVYRNLKALQAAGKVSRVDLPGQPPRWEVSREDHHHHFLCRACDRMYEIPGCPLGIDRLLPEGYTMEGHDILLSGVCHDCSGETVPKNKRPSR